MTLRDAILINILNPYLTPKYFSILTYLFNYVMLSLDLAALVIRLMSNWVVIITQIERIEYAFTVNCPKMLYF